jgi:glutamate racemase
MKIGVFDSGLGGLVILKSLIKKLPEYDYLYLGDTKNLPYGEKSQEEIFKLAKKAVEYLFKQDCGLVVIACNTISSSALRRIQREYLPKSKYSNRRVLGVIRPTVEVLKSHDRVGVMATTATVKSRAFSKEIKKINPNIFVVEEAAPKLVPMIESNSLVGVENEISKYIRPLLKKKISALILGCTHYPMLDKKIRKAVGDRIRILSQDKIVPKKLATYLQKHREIEKGLSKNRRIELKVTSLERIYPDLVKGWFSKSIQLKLVKY